MALQKTYREVAIAGGIDAKTDRTQVAPPRTLVTENGYFVTNGTIKKRYGWASLSASILNGGSISAGVAIGTANNELLLDDAAAFYAWQPTVSKWASRGVAGAAAVTLRQDYAPGTTLPFSGLQMVSAGNYTVYAWEQVVGLATGRVGVAYYAIKDTATSQWVVAPRQIPSGNPAGFAGFGGTAGFPVLVTFGAYIYLFVTMYYVDGGGNSNWDLAYCVINSASPTTTPFTSDSFTRMRRLNLAANPAVRGFFHYDACTFNNKLYVTSNGAAATALDIFNTAGSGVSSSIAGPAALANMRITTCSNNVYLAIVGTTEVVLMSTANAFGAPLAYGAFDSTRVFAATFLANGASTTLRAVGTEAGAGNIISVPFAITGLGAIVAGASTRLLPGLVGSSLLLTRPFLYGTGLYVIAAATGAISTTLQPTGFLVNAITGDLGARFLYDSASTDGAESTIQPSSVVNVSTGVYAAPVTQALGLLPNAAGANTQINAVDTVTLTFGGTRQILPFREGAVTANGLCGFYDGSAYYEQGFSQYPELAAPTISANGGTGLDNGATYKYVAVYRRIDAFGNEHFSSPSPTISVVVTAGAGNNQVNWAVIPGYQANTDTLMYRQKQGDTAFPGWHEVGSATGISLSFVDKLTDAAAAGNRSLYAPPDGTGELQNDPPPALSMCVATKTRLFGLSSEFPSRLYYSKPFRIGRGPEWSALQFRPIDPATGAIVALAALDEKVVIFKQGTAYYIYGDGPDATGANGDFSPPVQIPVDSGCTDPKSLAVTDDGVFYKSARGIMLLNRALGGSEYVGAFVEPYNETITSAVVVPTLSQVRFGTNSARVLVYDYFLKRWSTFTNMTGVAAVNWANQYTFLKSDGTVNVENTGFLDSATPIALRVRLPWLPMSGPQGWGRLYRALMIGDYKSVHTLQMHIYYDYDDTSFDTVSYVHDPANPVYQFRCKMPRQVMQAVSLEFVDTGTTGESYAISSVVLELGIKSGAAKLPLAKSV